MSPLSRLSVLLMVIPLTGCTRCSDKGTGPTDAATSASAIPSTSAPASAGSAGANDGGLSAAGHATVGSLQIPAGPAPNGTWTVEYGLERVAGDENLDWAAASAHCREKGKELCLETQWQRACELDSRIGALESWTLTADFPGAAVRGGPEGCNARSFHKVDEKSPNRVGLCCDRVVAITSEDKSDELRTAANKRVLEIEAAMSAGTTESLEKLFDEKISFEGEELERAAALAKLGEQRKNDPSRLAFYDHCNVKVNADETPPAWIADCGVVLFTQGKTRGFPQRIMFASATGPVKYLGDPKAMKPKEQKERVKSFLPSE